MMVEIDRDANCGIFPLTLMLNYEDEESDRYAYAYSVGLSIRGKRMLRSSTMRLRIMSSRLILRT